MKLDSQLLNMIIRRFFTENSNRSVISYYIVKKYISKNLLHEIPLSNFRDQGITVYQDQKLTMPLERALRSFYNINRFSKYTGDHIFFFGIDNLCASGVIMPYVLKIIGVEDRQLPKVILNQFCYLEGKKISTSKNHLISAETILKLYPIDMIKLYFSHINNTSSPSDFSMSEFIQFSHLFLDKLICVTDILCSLYEENECDFIEAGPWTVNDINFHKIINDARSHCISCYSNYSTKDVIRKIINMIDDIYFYCLQSKDLNRVYDNDRKRTQLALSAYAFKSLSFMLYPIMTNFSKEVMSILSISIEDYTDNNLKMSVVKNINLSKLSKILEIYKSSIA
jgi:methionyl-tRNA synthetase